MNTYIIGRTAIYVIVAGLLALTVAACQPHQELKSNCHVAGVVPETGCDFTPIGGNRAS